MIGRSSRRLVGIVRNDGEWAVALRSGEVAFDLPTAALAVAPMALYGVGMGTFAVAHGLDSWKVQILASAVKVPTLALVSFALTCPVFFAANAVGGLRLPAISALRLWAATFAVFAAVLGCLAPATGLVSLVCNYSFATLINLAFFTAAGLTAVGFVLRSVGVLKGSARGPAGRRNRALLAFAGWAVVFALVGAQVGWRMRPLIGWRDATFIWFRLDGMSLWDGVTSEIYNILTVGGV